jgi:hypothetical protein
MKTVYMTCYNHRVGLSIILIIILLVSSSFIPQPKGPTVVNIQKSTQLSSSLTFWVINNHDGCRVDTTTLLQGLNQTIIIADHVGRRSPYIKAFTRPNILFLREKHQLARLMETHRGHSDRLTEDDIRNFFSYYHKDPIMLSVNAFYCSFPMSLCEVYMPFNRTIIWLPAHRFTLARCSRPEIDRLIQHLQQSVQPNQQPKHFLAAGGRYDQEYIKYYTGLDAILLPTNAFWYAFNVTKFTQTRNEILVGPLQHSSHSLIANMEEAAKLRNSSLKFATAKSLYGRYELEQLANHRAVVLLPYAVLSYGITELYALGIPIFVPSIEFIVKLKLIHDRTLIDNYYCGPQLKFSDMSRQHPNSNHPYSPEDIVSTEGITYWLQFADYYQLPHIRTFASWENLIEKLSIADFSTINKQMYEENLKRKTKLIENWKSIFAQIDPKPRIIPDNYDFAIKQLWNTTKLQVI